MSLAKLDLVFDDLPTPSFGKPLFNPSSKRQALHISILEIYPHLVQLPCEGNRSLTVSLNFNCSPECMISKIEVGRIFSRSLM